MFPSSPLARKIEAFVALSEDESAVLAGLHQRSRCFEAGRDLVRQGQSGQSAFILAEGWSCTYKLLRNGARHIVDFQIPGDFPGLRGVLYRKANHGMSPVTRVRASEVLREELLAAFVGTPRLAVAILWAGARDEALLVEHLVRLGKRSAAQRTAHLFLELGARLRLVGLHGADGFACPLTQYLLADALGLSAIHVNRSLRLLREGGMMTFQNGYVRFDDFDRLVAFADFDTAYLHLGGPPMI
ncbi:Crp/Fnr family transcriptional regulator [Paracoccaceae bacterium Fryx2]|nr:Crp/Fnr family transcriptional regulator [Paracoccaceae bacterium Fryx2]